MFSDETRLSTLLRRWHFVNPANSLCKGHASLIALHSSSGTTSQVHNPWVFDVGLRSWQSGICAAVHSRTALWRFGDVVQRINGDYNNLSTSCVLTPRSTSIVVSVIRGIGNPFANSLLSKTARKTCMLWKRHFYRFCNLNDPLKKNVTRYHHSFLQIKCKLKYTLQHIELFYEYTKI